AQAPRGQRDDPDARPGLCAVLLFPSAGGRATRGAAAGDAAFFSFRGPDLMSNLLEQKCERRAAPMTEPEVRNHLAQSSGWREAGVAIEKTFAFKGWLETVAFVNAL